MRLNASTFPAWIALSNNDLLHLQVDEALYSHYKDRIYQIIYSAKECFDAVPAKHRYYITDTFYEAVDKAYDKVTASMHEESESNNELFRNCMFIHKSGFAMHKMTYNEDEIYTELYIFSKTALIGYGKIQHRPTMTDSLTWGVVAHKDAAINPHKLFNQLFQSYIVVMYFIKNCEIEIVVVQPKAKAVISNVKYYNEGGDTSITILDCRWFRELIRDTPFSVNGHLRWQRCGQNFSKKKLIWIEGFEKSGYHRKATKQKNN